MTDVWTQLLMRLLSRGYGEGGGGVSMVLCVKEGKPMRVISKKELEDGGLQSGGRRRTENETRRGLVAGRSGGE